MLGGTGGVWLTRLNALTSFASSGLSFLRAAGGELPTTLIGHGTFGLYFFLSIIQSILGFMVSPVHESSSGTSTLKLQIASLFSCLLGFINIPLQLGLFQYYTGGGFLKDQLTSGWDALILGLVWISLLQGIIWPEEYKTVSTILPVIVGIACAWNYNAFGVLAMIVVIAKIWLAPEYLGVITGSFDSTTLMRDIDLSLLTSTLLGMGLSHLVNTADPAVIQENVYLKAFHDHTGVQWW